MTSTTKFDGKRSRPTRGTNTVPLKAERLVAEWKPNPADCEVEEDQTRNRRNVRFGS